MRYDYDVIVIGGGHAGCEAAAASARLGSKTLLITSDMNRIAQMSCNPAIGGIAKGQIVREIDALGGYTGIVTDRSAIQFRMLNRSKGPAVWSPRSQCDRTQFIDEWRRILDSIPNLYIVQDTVTEFMFENGEKTSVKAVKTALGIIFEAQAVVLTAGTFLNGLMHFGEVKVPGGRISETASYGLTEQLVNMGFTTGRMKTGTPVRIDGRSVDYDLVEVQDGDDVAEHLADGSISIVRDFHKFSYLPDVERRLTPRSCFIVHTNREAHMHLQKNLDRSPMYNGQIQSIGPRYCPSIETKIVTFPDRDSHQLFLEPEGETTSEFYVNGFSSSLPADVQTAALHEIPALKNVHIYRPGYAIEYDFFDPTQLTRTLETKLIDGLYFAGQVNGTTGYEEAAGQGLIAGANAALKLQGKPEFTLSRDNSYIGVLIDDLITKGVDEPYRMFTSRAEYRILLRQDDADMRLTPLAYKAGLATEERYRHLEKKRSERDSLIEYCRNHKLKMGSDTDAFLAKLGCPPLRASTSYYELLKRPQLDFATLCTHSISLATRIADIPENMRAEVAEAAEILIKYEGYIARERELAEKASRLEYVELKPDTDYSSIKALSTEARQKLTRLRPVSIGQASRIPGVSPADISVLLLMCNR